MFDPLKAKGRVLLYTALAFLMGMGLASGLGWTDSSHAMPVVQDRPQVSEEAVRPALDLSQSFVNIAETVTPAVVRIQVERPRRAALRGGQFPDQLRRFFDIPEEDRDQQPRAPDIQLGGGSGFIVSSDGYILTNDHVVSGAERIQVFLSDRRQFEAELVGTDPTTDVAVIKIEDEGSLPTLSFGESDGLRVGEWILAVGNPGFGSGSTQLDYTVTAGIVSAKGRPLRLIQNELMQEGDRETARFAIEDFIQTDAVINPGNSGGPMVNLRGQVVGINSAIASRTGFYQGYGFAIPVDLARRIMEDLIEYGKVRRPWLGVSITDVDPVDAEAYDLPDVSGVLVSDLPEDGPAARAGLQAEDVIVSLDGTQVERVNQLQNLVARHRPGDRVQVGIYRGGERREIQVRLGEAPISSQPEPAPERVARAEERLGIQVMDMTVEMARQLGYDTADGAVITDVQPLGPAARRGVAPGRRILQINGEPVEDAEDVKAILEGLEPGQIVTFRLENPLGEREIVNVRVPS